MKILFKIYAQKSHYNATFELATALKKDGHSVLYAGVGKMKTYVESQGFQYAIDEKEQSEHKEGSICPARYSILKQLQRVLANRRWVNSVRRQYVSKDFFGSLLRITKPDLLLVDSPYVFFALSAKQHQVPFAILESMGNLNRDCNTPPYDTIFTPSNSVWSRLRCDVCWKRYFAKRFFRAQTGTAAEDDPAFVLMTAREHGFAKNEINCRRYFHIGIESVPEFILTPRLFDFPRIPRSNQCYLDRFTGRRRIEEDSGPCFQAKLRELEGMREKGMPIIYCSLGTAPWLYNGVVAFYKTLIEAAAVSQWTLVLAAGEAAKMLGNRVAHKNVLLCDSAPQLAVLRIADLMITHGGMNSIKECIVAGVPMIVAPGNKETDQYGNAARVKYHRLGLTITLNGIAINFLKEAIQSILEDATFKNNVKRMQASMIKLENERQQLDDFYYMISRFCGVDFERRHLDGRGA